MSRTSLSNGGLSCTDQRNQAFNPNIAFLPNGLLGVIYGDFRNFDITQSAVVNTDYWLAIYKETSDVSTNAGLQFVTEIRLTNPSFDAAIGFDSLLLGIDANSGLAAGRGCNFLTAFGVTNEGDLPVCNSNPPTCPENMVVDTNNRINVFFERVSANEEALKKNAAAPVQKVSDRKRQQIKYLR